MVVLRQGYWGDEYVMRGVAIDVAALPMGQPNRDYRGRMDAKSRRGGDGDGVAVKTWA